MAAGAAQPLPEASLGEATGSPAHPGSQGSAFLPSLLWKPAFPAPDPTCLVHHTQPHQSPCCTCSPHPPPGLQPGRGPVFPHTRLGTDGLLLQCACANLNWAV